MSPPLLDTLSRPARSVVSSAGYRVARWSAAREVLGNRLAKNRISGLLGETLSRWGVGKSSASLQPEFHLTFGAGEPGQPFWLCDGPADQPLERALLHLPALRSFWRQELRQRHFDALRSMVPKAWLPDESPVPPGAVIQSLGVTSWKDAANIRQRVPALAMDGRFLTEQISPAARINATYHRDDKRRVLLRSVEALP